jgi:hypothetical protein
MNEQNFLENYLWPSEDKLDRTFSFPVPNIEGLKKCGDFIVQCELEDTFSTNIITKYESDSGIILKDVYKNTQNKVTGILIRLVGGMNIVKNGYPRLSLDAPILNVIPLTGEKVDITTRMFVTLAQADMEQRKILFDHLNEQAKEAGISHTESISDMMPEFWGPRWIAETKGVNLDLFRRLRDYTWNAYKCVIEETKEKLPFDYRPLQEQMVFNVASSEHLVFKRAGMSVPVEAQAAFFSVTVPHI